LKYCYFLFDGYSSVVGASEILIKNDIDNRIVRTPVNMSGCCGFAVVIHAEQFDISMDILINNKRQPLIIKYK